MTNTTKSLAPQIMGILNVTPDSFSDGGQHNKPDQAVDRAIEMVKQGASIIDIGGESTRPGAEKVSTQEQLARVIPVIEGIRNLSAVKDTIISIDTTDYHVAKQAIEAGANWINDISAGEDSEQGANQMISLAALLDCPIILMHRQGKSDRMQENPTYNDVCKEVIEYLQERAQLALDSGVLNENIILDPGIGFGKTLEHNLALLSDLGSLVALGFPVLLGTSRKRFLGEILGEDDPVKRVIATCATTALGVQAGVNIFRVHDVKENKQTMDVAWFICSRGNTNIEHILGFWFSKPMSDHWFTSSPEIDQNVTNNYESIWEQAKLGYFDGWKNTADGCLALCIILDQLPLNMFRGQAKSFSTEQRAIKIAKYAIENGLDNKISADRVAFLYMPLMHSEKLDDQELAVKCFEKVGLDYNLRFAKHHRGIIEEFGRFPHRNEALGRLSSLAEIDYLKSDRAFTG